MDDIWDSKRANLVLDHLVQLLLQLRSCLCARVQSDVGIDALPLDLMVYPELHNKHLRGMYNAAALHFRVCIQVSRLHWKAMADVHCELQKLGGEAGQVTFAFLSFLEPGMLLSFS